MHSLQNKIHNIVYAGFKGPLKIGERECQVLDPMDLSLLKAIAQRKLGSVKKQSGLLGLIY